MVVKAYVLCRHMYTVVSFCQFYNNTVIICLLESLSI